jgi:very-short-patch-repair endonuclease
MCHNPPLHTETLLTTRRLRDTGTDAERKLWCHLRAGRLDGLRFRRQHPLPPYVVDFYCHACRLVIELDGSQHTSDGDAIRTQALNRQGLLIVRFWDNQVLLETEAVLEAILTLARNRTLPQPLPRRERGSHTFGDACLISRLPC